MKYVVVGLGVSGMSCVRFLKAQKADVSVFDRRRDPAMIEQLQQAYPDVEFNSGEFSKNKFAHADVIVLSPGVPSTHTVFVELAELGKSIIGDIELFAQHVKAPVLAITGTNGKSTVTTLLGDILQNAGLKVKVGGNLGLPALDLLTDDDVDYYVLELSSFQLETTYSLKPHAAAILNITPDHLDRYPSFDDYIAAKHRIFQHTKTQIYNLDDSNIKPQQDVSSISFSLASTVDADYGVKFENEQACLYRGNTSLLPVSQMKLRGRQNWANALAAVALADTVNCPNDAIITTLKEFSGLEHRCEWVANIKEVDWINDSKGTNVAAASEAIFGFASPKRRNILLIAGGQAKEQNFTPLQAPASTHVAHAILFGEDQAKLRANLEYQTEVHAVDDLDSAVSLASELATPGDTVLLSPACASFDMFNDFEHRGRVFKQLVGKLTL